MISLPFFLILCRSLVLAIFFRVFFFYFPSPYLMCLRRAPVSSFPVLILVPVPVPVPVPVYSYTPPPRLAMAAGWVSPCAQRLQVLLALSFRSVVVYSFHCSCHFVPVFVRYHRRVAVDVAWAFVCVFFLCRVLVCSLSFSCCCRCRVCSVC